MEETTTGSLQEQSGPMGGALLIGLVTLLGYMTTVSYHVGYNSYFNIPTFFIPMDIASVLKVTAYTFSALLFFSIFLDAVIKAFSTKKNTIFFRNLGIYIGFVVIILSFILYVFPPSKTQIIASIVSIVSLGFFEYGLPIFQRGKTYIERYDAAQEHSVVSEEISPFDRNINLFVRKYLGMFLLIAFIIFAAYAAGDKHAKEVKYFDLLSNQPNTVVLQTYKDFLIVSNFDPSSHKLNGKVYLISLSSIADNGYFLTSSSTGRLIPLE